MTTAQSSGGSSGRSSASGVGASLKMRDATCITLSPTKGGRPASASKRMVPSDQMSARRVDVVRRARAARAASTPASRRTTTWSSASPPRPAESSALEMPKSSTFTIDVPSGRRREEEVRRLEVAVDDPGGVRLGDGLAGLQDVRHRLLGGQRAALGERLRPGRAPRGTPSRCTARRLRARRRRARARRARRGWSPPRAPRA